MSLIRQIANSLVIVLFLLGTIGVNINKHYCKGRLAKVSFWGASDPCCKKAPSNNQFSKNCCSSEEINLAFDDDFQKQQFEFESKNYTPETRTESIRNHQYAFIDIEIISERAPPELQKKLYILHSSLKLCA